MIDNATTFINSVRDTIFKRSRDFQKAHNNIYDKVVSCCFYDYLSLLKSHGITDDSQEYIDAKQVITELSQIVSACLSGKRSKAYFLLKNLMNNMLSDGMICEHDYDSYLYRMRVCDMRRDIHRKELFHIPFELRRMIATQRYSTPGYPCLYLARSIYGCWEEMHRPPINSTLVSLFKAREEYAINNGCRLNLIDLRIPDATRFNNNELFYISFLPIVIACTIPVSNRSDIFKPEYLIPQLVLEWVIEEGKSDNAYGENIIGVTYTSSFYNEEFFSLDFEWDNIAIPVQTVTDSGYCPTLGKLFELTKPTCYEYELMQGNINTTGYWYNGPKRGHGNDDPKQDYYWSIFSRLEEELETRGRDLIYLTI